MPKVCYLLGIGAVRRNAHLVDFEKWFFFNAPTVAIGGVDTAENKLYMNV